MDEMNAAQAFHPLKDGRDDEERFVTLFVRVFEFAGRARKRFEPGDIPKTLLDRGSYS
jgi:hypothetical protein